jgi:hypothetical protein
MFYRLTISTPRTRVSVFPLPSLLIPKDLKFEPENWKVLFFLILSFLSVQLFKTFEKKIHPQFKRNLDYAYIAVQAEALFLKSVCSDSDIMFYSF